MIGGLNLNRVLVSVALACCIIFSGTFSALAVHNKQIVIKTPADYEKYLTECAKSDPKVLESRDKFKVLSQEKKQKLIYYITNLEVMGSVLNELFSQTEARKELYDGDIIICGTSTIQECQEIEEKPKRNAMNFIASLVVGEVSAAGSNYQFTAKHTQDIKIFGVTVFKSNVWVKYNSQNKKIVKSVINGGSSLFNIVLVNISKDSSSSYVYRNKAHHDVVYKCTPIGGILGFISYSIHHYVHGYPNGKRTHSYWLGS